jgi:hypothetical protein
VEIKAIVRAHPAAKLRWQPTRVDVLIWRELPFHKVDAGRFMEQHGVHRARTVSPEFQSEVVVVRQREGAPMVRSQPLARTVAADHDQPTGLIQSNAKGDAAATIEADEGLEELSINIVGYGRRSALLQVPAAGRGLRCPLPVSVELHGLVLEPDAPVGTELKQIVVSMRDRQVKAESLPAQRSVVGGDAHDAIGWMLTFAGVVRKVLAWARTHSDGGLRTAISFRRCARSAAAGPLRRSNHGCGSSPRSRSRMGCEITGQPECQCPFVNTTTPKPRSGNMRRSHV